MNWIQRNLFFLIGAVVSVGLLAFAGFYTYSGWKHNAEAKNARIEAYEELKRLWNLPVHPGSGKVDNVKAAREQQKAVRALFAKAIKNFQPPPAIPASADGTNISGSQFNTALRETVDQLTRAASSASVILPQDFKFSFSKQLSLLVFASGSLQPLSVQLGEVKALCDVLIQAKVNSLDAIQRERVSSDDFSGPAGDYVDFASVSSELAVLTPYQITFRSFSPEIAGVLAGYANSPYGIVVKSINVEPAPSLATEQTPAMPYAVAPVAPAPTYQPPRRSAAEEEAIERAMLRPDLYQMPKAYPTPSYAPPSTYAPPAYTAPAPFTLTPGARPGAPQTLEERPLRVTLLVEVVKLLPVQ